jgi:hypothetical protein
MVWFACCWTMNAYHQKKEAHHPDLILMRARLPVLHSSPLGHNTNHDSFWYSLYGKMPTELSKMKKKKPIFVILFHQIILTDKN